MPVPSAAHGRVDLSFVPAGAGLELFWVGCSHAILPAGLGWNAYFFWNLFPV
jgi:hypothetical protein